ncbi:MAG: STAS/SEC14 domain-containing protein [Pseudomonadota bacterium]
MLNTPSTKQVKSARPDLFAFRIVDAVQAEDMEAMARVMNAAFDTHADKVDMLLIFDSAKGSEAGAGLRWETLKSQVKSLSHVNRYVVVGAPDRAAQLVEAMNTVLPVKAEAFDNEVAAWRSLGVDAIAA